jgi:hypothetical protein
MKSELAIAVLLAVVVLAAACGGSGGPQPTRTPAQSASVADVFPQESDFENCVLHGGGPPPGLTLEGRCASQSVSQDGAQQVTTVEEWRCADFSGNVPGYDPCAGEFGRYTIVSVVREGVSEVISASGQFPPSLAQ